MRFLLGTAFWIIVVLYIDRRFIHRDKYLRQEFEERRKYEAERRDHAERSLVQAEKHTTILKWLSDERNYPEIQAHIRNVLKEIWERDVNYTVHGDPGSDIRSVIYFVENGFLPGLYAKEMRVQYHTGDTGLLRNMTDDEFRRLIRWTMKTFQKRGTYIYLGDGILGGEWKYEQI